jgi:putative membrane-bound dehydrogenase-like protein
MQRIAIFFFAVMVVLSGVRSVATAAPYDDDYRLYEFPARPNPAWVRMLDLAPRDPRLAGMEAPAGVKVEIVAQEPAVINPVGITFDESGDLYALEWVFSESQGHAQYDVTFRDGTTVTIDRTEKSSPDVLKKLVDEDGDGTYERADVVIDDLELPGSALFLDGWVTVPSVGHVIRRRQSTPGSSYDVEEEILRGLCGMSHHQVSGATLSDDNWLFISTGDNDNRPEGSDGSRAYVLRTGAVFRCRPDGSQVEEFARGFRNPYRNVALDHLGNIFHVDNDQEEGSKFQGVRLLHILDASDFGWRLRPGSGCCQTDVSRAAFWGEIPGTVPGLVKTGRGAPSGLTIYQGTRFPKFFRGLLLYPDVFRQTVRAYRVEPSGSSFRVVEQFELLRSNDPLFRPCEAVVGPDGAVYICDWRTHSAGAGQHFGNGKNGRIYRLTWDGLEGAPAIAPGPKDVWAAIARQPDEELIVLLDGPDFELRRRALRELVRRVEDKQSEFSLVAFAKDASRSLAGRVAAIGGACRSYSASVQGALLDLMEDDEADLRRLACDLLSRNTTADHLEQTDRLVAHRLAQLVVFDVSNAVRRAAALALGRVVSLVPGQEAVGRSALDALVAAFRSTDGSDPHLRHGLAQAFGRSGSAGMDRLRELIESGDAEARETCVAVLETLRSRGAGELLDELLASHPPGLAVEQWVRLMVAYRYIIVEPPHPTVAISRWLTAHKDADPRIQMAALESLGLSKQFGADVGSAEVIEATALRLLGHSDAETRVLAIRSVGNARLKGLTRHLIAALGDVKRGESERRAIVEALGKLRAGKLYFRTETTEPGIDSMLDDVIALAKDANQGALRAEILVLVSQIDLDRAKPVALAWLDSPNRSLIQAAVGVLGTDSDETLAIGKRFIDGKLDRHFLPQVAELLRRHAARDSDAEFGVLLAQVLQGAVASADDQARLGELLASGDAHRGRDLFRDVERTKCLTCHRLQGDGGQVGPDLTGIWQSHTQSKLVEALLTPSAEIKEGYAAWTVLTLEGQVYSGLKVAESDEVVILRDVNGNDLRVPVDHVILQEESATSLMPDGLVAQLSLAEIADLVAFLSSQEAQEAMGEGD